MFFFIIVKCCKSTICHNLFVSSPKVVSVFVLLPLVCQVMYLYITWKNELVKECPLLYAPFSRHFRLKLYVVYFAECLKKVLH